LETEVELEICFTLHLKNALIREALRRYQQEKRWEKVVRYQARAESADRLEHSVATLQMEWGASHYQTNVLLSLYVGHIP
jgi:hypothetical protein